MKPAPFRVTFLCVLVVLLCPPAESAQQPGRRGVIGEVATVDAANRRLQVVADSGDSYSVTVTDSTKVQKVPPGATGLEGATDIPLEQVAPGDRVYVRGAVDAERAAIEAASVVVMSRQDISARQREQREQWRRRGIAGIVTGVDAATGKITIEVRGRGRSEPVEVLASGPEVKFKRYAPGSARYEKAVASSIQEIRPGDHLRALGDRQDGTFNAQEIVSGAFRSFAGRVEQVDAAAKQLVVRDAATGQKLTLGINAESSLRHVPETMVSFMARRSAAGAADGPPPMQRPAGDSRQGAPPEGGPQGGRGDLREMLARMPAVELTELKPGETVGILAAMPSSSGQPVAVALLTGIETLVRPAENGSGRMPMMDSGLSGLLEQSLEMPQQ